MTISHSLTMRREFSERNIFHPFLSLLINMHFQFLTNLLFFSHLEFVSFFFLFLSLQRLLLFSIFFSLSLFPFSFRFFPSQLSKYVVKSTLASSFFFFFSSLHFYSVSLNNFERREGGKEKLMRMERKKKMKERSISFPDFRKTIPFRNPSFLLLCSSFFFPNSLRYFILLLFLLSLSDSKFFVFLFFFFSSLSSHLNSSLVSHQEGMFFLSSCDLFFSKVLLLSLSFRWFQY